jgi:hypothetical protein
MPISLSEDQVKGLAEFLKKNGDVPGGKFVSQLVKDGEIVGKFFDANGILPCPDPAAKNKLHNLAERTESIMAYGLLIAMGRK